MSQLEATLTTCLVGMLEPSVISRLPIFGSAFLIIAQWSAPSPWRTLLRLCCPFCGTWYCSIRMRRRRCIEKIKTFSPGMRMCSKVWRISIMRKDCIQAVSLLNVLSQTGMSWCRSQSLKWWHQKICTRWEVCITSWIVASDIVANNRGARVRLQALPVRLLGTAQANHWRQNNDISYGSHWAISNLISQCPIV